MKKLILSIVCIFSFIPFVSASIYENGQYSYGIDDAENILTSAEREELLFYEKNIAKYHSVYFIFSTTRIEDYNSYWNDKLEEIDQFKENSVLFYCYSDYNSMYIKVLNLTGDLYNKEDFNRIINDRGNNVGVKAITYMLNNFIENLGGQKVYYSTAKEISELSENVNGHEIIIRDEANKLNGEERKNLLEIMKLSSEYGHIMFLTGNFESSYDGTKRFVENYYHNRFGMGTSGTIFCIDFSSRYLYIFSDGKVYDKITPNVADTITANVYKLASNEEYYLVAKNTFEQIYTKLSGKRIFSLMKVITTGLLSLLISIIVLYSYTWRKSGVKPKRGKDLIKYSKVNFTNVFGGAKFTHQRKIYVPPSSSGGSSGGGGGGGGGGGSSGGGGGHGF